MVINGIDYKIGQKVYNYRSVGPLLDEWLRVNRLYFKKDECLYWWALVNPKVAEITGNRGTRFLSLSPEEFPITILKLPNKRTLKAFGATL